MPVDMRVRLGQVELPNLVLTASGCAGAGRELAQFIDVARLGALISKSIMTEPRTGNPAPRLAETPSGMLNSVGWQGPGIDAFLQRDLPWLLSRGARVVVSIAGQTIHEYAELAARLSDTAGVTAIEVNLACPECRGRGQAVRFRPAAGGQRDRGGAGPRQVRHPRVRQAIAGCDRPRGGGRRLRHGRHGRAVADQPMLGMAIDPVTMRPALAGTYGGLSGPAIRPVAVRCVWQVREAFPTVPIIGMGGVRTGRDALELLLAGATMVAVGTEIMHDPAACSRVLRELEEELAAMSVDRAADVVARLMAGSPAAWRDGRRLTNRQHEIKHYVAD